MKSWHRVSDDIKLKDSSVKREYKLTFETDDYELVKRVEQFFYVLMDEKAEREEE